MISKIEFISKIYDSLNDRELRLKDDYQKNVTLLDRRLEVNKLYI